VKDTRSAGERTREFVDALAAWVERQTSPDGSAWLATQRDRVRAADTDRALYTAFGMAPAKLGKAGLALDATDLQAAQRTRDGWNPRAWTVDQAARVVLVLETHAGDDAAFGARLERLFATADVGEAVALYRGLPLYPHAPAYVARAGEGARSNMRSTFEAVAHDNPYPAEFFSEAAWNQMVVKALFIGSTLAPIAGLAARENAELALMLRGYAHERWAAGRTVSPEVWRCVGRFGGEAAVSDLRRVLEGDGAVGRRAAALALAANGTGPANELLATIPDLADAVARGTLTWETLSNPRDLEEARPV
jgi:hypothetical protein